jgi:signal transduction histidine kinase
MGATRSKRLIKQLIKKGIAHFQTEGRLLQELGERLVASPEVALVELVKNAYDADASTCRIVISESGDTLTIEDDGVGMPLDDFEKRWMRVATPGKMERKGSRKFDRRVTGQKGIGRFAVRFLGTVLELESVAEDSKLGRTRLEAKFDWPKIDTERDLGDAKIPYTLTSVDSRIAPGTRLHIKNLRMDAKFVRGKEFYTRLLRIVSPIQGLEAKRFGRAMKSGSTDPGFRVVLPRDAAAKDSPFDLSKQVLAAAWARLEIELEGRSLLYTVTFHGDPTPRKLKVPVSSKMSQGCRADIRFFPKRKGVFRGQKFNGTQGWSWVRDNHGVAVLDHGFRVKPFGFPEDDWLKLDMDGAHNKREWRSEIANEYLPISPKEKNNPALNPTLNLPGTHQLVGAVFVESRPASLQENSIDLVPSMDREGFLDNAAFQQLTEVVRGGIEFLAAQDKQRLLEEKERVAKAAVKSMRADLRSAIQHIEQSENLSPADKVRIATHYASLAERVDEVEAYNQDARRKLEIMSSLGVVAGFMTHEATQASLALERASDSLSKLARRFPQLADDAKLVNESANAMQDLVEYTRSFIEATHSAEPRSFNALAQVRRIIAKFGRFARQRGIEVTAEVEDKLETPSMPVTIYSGVLLNLYTNALKAILALKHSERGARIVFRARNEGPWHVVEVLDTGIGVPPELHARIWDPLFTTTSQSESPLGSGMGLGLTLVRELVTGIGGKIEMTKAPEGFSTCFRIRFPGVKSSGR